MLQYLINASAIWLISLVLFDVFLRRESYHSYNRLYLLTTFLMGIFVPIWQWQDKGTVHTIILQKQITSVINTKEAIVVTGKAATIHIEQWLMIIYLTGAFIALCILIADIIKLVSLYRKGKLSRQGRWTIVVTGNGHAPFSFFNTLFVCSREQYSMEEWNMILEHEQQHTTLFHFADLLLMQLAKVIFWFHPLVYLYTKRLLMVHEYQADNAKAQPKEYGHFLVTQCLMQNAPSITHSFNHSPIKNRIIMLTQSSTNTSRMKLLVIIPISFICVVFFSKNAISQNNGAKKPSMVHLGNLSSVTEATFDEVAANTFIVPSDPSYKVKEFTVTYIPKDTFIVGPFKAQGNQFTQKQKDMLQLTKGKKFKLVIEDIKLEKDGKEIAAGVLFFTCKP